MLALVLVFHLFRSVALTLASTLALPLTLGMELANVVQQKAGKQDICQNYQDWLVATC